MKKRHNFERRVQYQTNGLIANVMCPCLRSRYQAQFRTQIVTILTNGDTPNSLDIHVYDILGFKGQSKG